jgi:hypothetical protein
LPSLIRPSYEPCPGESGATYIKSRGVAGVGHYAPTKRINRERCIVSPSAKMPMPATSTLPKWEMGVPQNKQPGMHERWTHDRDEQPPHASHATRDAHCDIAIVQLFVRCIVFYITVIGNERNAARSSARRPPCTRETFAGKFTNT